MKKRRFVIAMAALLAACCFFNSGAFAAFASVQAIQTETIGIEDDTQYYIMNLKSRKFLNVVTSSNL